MNLFQRIEQEGHEQVVFCHEPTSGLRAIIAIHDTTLGPALGGCRMWDYRSDYEALEDVLRLSKGMTYKAATAGLNLGGGKAVIIGDYKTQKSEALFRAFGRFVDACGGRYITAEDVGTSVQDMEFVAAETKYVTGVSLARGGSGDPSPVTAFGIYKGIKACVKEKLQRSDLAGLRFAVQGLGKVGFYLSKHLVEEKAKVFGCDIDREKAKKAEAELKVELVSPEEIFDVDCEILAPCALGGVINDATLPRLKCKIVAGGANNQLAEDRHGDELDRRGILYAPDFVINAGGLINVYCEIEGYNHERAMSMAEQIGTKLHLVFEIARQEHIPTYRAADRLAERRIEAVRRLKRL